MSTTTDPVQHLQRDLDRLARFDAEEEQLLQRLEEVRAFRAGVDDWIRVAVGELEARCAEDPAAGAAEMRAAFAGREHEVSRSITRRLLKDVH